MVDNFYDEMEADEDFDDVEFCPSPTTAFTAITGGMVSHAALAVPTKGR